MLKAFLSVEAGYGSSNKYITKNHRKTSNMPLFTERKLVHAQQESDPEREGATLTTRVEDVKPGWFSSEEPHREVIVERETPARLSNLFLGETEEVSRTRK